MFDKRVKIISGVFLFLVFLIPQVSADQKISFKDHYGNEVILDKVAQRVVTIPKPAPSMFMAVDGSSEKIVGIHPSSMEAINEGILKDMFPNTQDIRHDICNQGGFVPNVEQMLRLKPDIVFQWGNQGMGIVDPIKNAGMTVALVKYGDQESLETMLNSFGAVVGKKQKVKDIIDWHRDTLKQLEKTTAGIEDTEKPRVLFFIRALSALKVAGSNTYHGQCIEMAGGTNPAKKIAGYMDVSPEQVIQWDPDVIFLNNFESGLSPKDIYDNPFLSGISAVKKKRVYRAPLGGYRWDPPNQESPFMWQWLSMIFHPDQIKWDIRREMKEKYHILYNYDLNEHEIDAILRIKMNGASSFYRQFEKS